MRGGEELDTWPTVHEDQRNGIGILGKDADIVHDVLSPVAVVDGDGELREFVYLFFMLTPILRHN